VPGNHDLVWPDENDLSFVACQQYFKDDRCRKGLLKVLSMLGARGKTVANTQATETEVLKSA
jgi:hypothetical protein